EISLTPQTIQCFQGRFGEVAVLHSHLGNAERGGHWRRIATGQVQIVVGARSAVFAPTRNLGLIVIDEEHEGSFKQEATPRYHGLSPSLDRAVRTALVAGGQVMLLLNRRGFSTHLHCPTCGHVETCRFCDLALTYHRDRDVALCHYCGYEQTPPELCPKCGQ